MLVNISNMKLYQCSLLWKHVGVNISPSCVGLIALVPLKSHCTISYKACGILESSYYPAVISQSCSMVGLT